MMKKILILIIVCSSTFSCAPVFDLFIPNEAKPKLLENEEMNKSVVYMPMTHLAKPYFFQDVKTHVLNLKSDGYIVFYESVKKIGINMELKLLKSNV